MRRASLLVMVVVAAAIASNASASQLVDRNASAIKLEVNSKGEALISYKAHGTQRHVLAWGAENAIAPTRTRQQVAFKLDYAGGWGKYHRDYWQDLQELVRRLRRTEAGVVRHRLHGVRRLVLGAPGLAAHAAELRRDGEPVAVGVGASALALDG